MDIYLDANATTPVLPLARAAALGAMAEDFGNPSSIHSSGLKAKVLIDQARETARRLLGADTGRLFFTSGATEGIQTAVLSALDALRQQRERGEDIPALLLYGATEHKAVPEALKHWNALLGLQRDVVAIPVGLDGRHDLDWLRRHAADAGLVCTMAANNETGVISDLEGIEAALVDSEALWLVDGVQGLGKLDMRLSQRRIDYAPFSGHKLYAPKGIGLLYVRESAPFTPLLAGGGQEGALRSGTENMSGIAALGAVLSALDDGQSFRDLATLERFRARLVEALQQAFAGVVFNAPLALALPTTLNFSVPGVASRLLLDLFDAADVRVSGGSACSAAKAQPSYVLQAMGLPEWQTASAVRMSFGPAAEEAHISEACARIRACGDSLRAHCVGEHAEARDSDDGITRFSADGACCYLIADAATHACVVIDPRPALVSRLAQILRCQQHRVLAILHTGDDADSLAAAADLRALVPECLHETAGSLAIGPRHLRTQAGCLVLEQDGAPVIVFGGEALPGALLAPNLDPDNRLVSTDEEPGAAAQRLSPAALRALAQTHADLLLVDVREPYEQRLSQAPELGTAVNTQAVALSRLLNSLPQWLALPAATPVVFYCRSGNRSAQAAAALARLGHAQSYTLAGGLALWPHV